MRALGIPGLALALALGACSHDKALIVSAAGLEAVGAQFSAVGAAMNAELDRQGLDRERCLAPGAPKFCDTYRGWAAFGRKFKVAFPAAVAAWKAADESQDETLLAQVAAIVATLSGELAAFLPPRGHP